MAASDALLAFARDPRLASHAFAVAPVWLWSADATRVIWANAAGAQVLGATDSRALAEQRFEPRHPAASDVARLRPVLPTSGAAQLSRLRGFVAGRPLTCACSRFRTAEGEACILVIAQETVKPVLAPSARVLRMLDAGPDAMVFAADGSLVHAGAAAAGSLAGRTTLEAIGADGLGRSALAAGAAEGATALGTMRLERLGAGDTAVLLATMEVTPAVEAAPAPTPDTAEATDAAEAIATDVVDQTVESIALSEESVAEAVQEAVAQPASADTATPDDMLSPSLTLPIEDAAATPVVTDTHPEPDAATDAQSAPDDAPSLAIPAPAAPPTQDERDAAALDDMERRLVERRHPLRFVWTIDTGGGFAIEAGDFTTLAGEPTTSMLGRSWQEVAQTLGLDREGRIQRAVASHDTWSGATVDWPAEGANERLPVHLSGLPVLGRDREFSGYRGFGVCRDVTRIAAVIAARRARADRAEATALEPLPDAAPALGTATEANAQAAEPDDDAAARTQPIDDAPRAEPAPTPPPRDMRAQLTVVPPSENVVPLRAGSAFERRPSLNPVERNAFQEIARALGARTDATDPAEQESIRSQRPPAQESSEDTAGLTDNADGASATEPSPGRQPIAFPARGGQAAHVAALALPDPLLRTVLDRVPAAILVYRGNELILANRALLEWTGYASLDALAAAGGLDALFGDPVTVERPAPDGPARALCLRAADGGTLAVDGRLSAIAHADASALMLVLTRAVPGDDRQQEAELALQTAEANARELASILDTAVDGVVIVDGEGRVLSLNRSAEALFGYDSRELVHQSFLDLIAPESQRLAADYLEGLTKSGVASLLNDGREVIGRVRQGGLVPLFMTMGRIADAPPRFCAVLRDITQWKRAEEELTSAKRLAEKASSAKSDFLAKISHEIRTPLNAIIGFSEVMMEERFGPVGNERYRGYVKDIHTSGEHMISLLNDLLDLSKIEAGKLDLTFAKVDLNDAMHQCVAIMQPQANRERIIIRTALSPALPPVVADARSVRQIVLNLLSNAIKFTGAGGQVIVSTALTDDGEAVLRVRDTGVGMSEQDIATALEPFRQLPTSARLNTAGTGLGLPLTKALAEANRAGFHIKSVPNAGTLVEIVFPANRVLAE